MLTGPVPGALAGVSVQGLALRDRVAQRPCTPRSGSNAWSTFKCSLMEAGQGPVEVRALFCLARLQGPPCEPTVGIVGGQKQESDKALDPKWRGTQGSSSRAVRLGTLREETRGSVELRFLSLPVPWGFLGASSE